MLELLLGCTLLGVVDFQLDTQQDVYRIPEIAEQCELVEEVQEWVPFIAAYFKKDQALALTVVYCESKGKSLATGYNKDGSIDQGLFQFNNRTEEWLEKDIYKRDLNMYDPLTNIRAAAWLSSNDGWRHWNSSKHCWGRFEK